VGDSGSIAGPRPGAASTVTALQKYDLLLMSVASESGLAELQPCSDRKRRIPRIMNNQGDHARADHPSANDFEHYL